MRKINAIIWYYSPDHRQLCQVIETQTLWGETTCRVWLPGKDTVVRVRMTLDLVKEISADVFRTVLYVAGPPLLAGLAIGLLSVFSRP